MKPKDIHYGDEVWVIFRTNTHFGDLRKRWEFLGSPQGSGDVYKFRDEEGHVIHLNPYNPEFVGIRSV